jgi:RNA polymerase sigma-70 factor (ECF subfamily)
VQEENSKQVSAPSTSSPGSGPVDTEQLVREHIGWMLSLAQRMIGEKSLAEDAVQDAFVSAFRGMANFKGRSTVKTWLHRITVNASLMILRKKKRLSEQSIDQYLPEFDRYDCRIEAPWPRLATADEILDNERLRTLVSEKVALLPDSYRIVFQLRDIEGYDTGEVAELLGVSTGNVKIRLHRARAVLKKLLEPVLRMEVQP